MNTIYVIDPTTGKVIIEFDDPSDRCQGKGAIEVLFHDEHGDEKSVGAKLLMEMGNEIIYSRTRIFE